MSKYKGVKHYVKLNNSIIINKIKCRNPETINIIKTNILKLLKNKSFISTSEINDTLNTDYHIQTISKALRELFNEDKIYFKKVKTSKYWTIL